MSDIDDLRAAVTAVDKADTDLTEARATRDHLATARDHLIRSLIAGGSRVVDLVDITGLSRARIYQIRDGIR